MDTTKIIKILDPQAGRLQETVLRDTPPDDHSPANLFEVGPARRMTLLEASALNEFPVLLRDGIKSITFDRYVSTPTTWPQFVAVEPSDKPAEDWAEENDIGDLPIVPENTAYPEFVQNLDRAVRIANQKRGGIISISEEIIKFNRTNLIKRQAQKLGRAAALTREQAAYSVLTTTGNYTRTSPTDNDIGNNTAATVFSAAGLNTALNTLRTMKDRRSGHYLGVSPNLLQVAPALEMAAKQLLLSPILTIPGSGVGTANVYGTGVNNPFRGLIDTIIVSPRVGTSYQWVLQEAKQALVLQEVDGLQILIEAPGQIFQEGYFRYDNVRYRVRDWFGVGMLNDRFAFYSSSSSAPAIG